MRFSSICDMHGLGIGCLICNTHTALIYELTRAMKKSFVEIRSNCCLEYIDFQPSISNIEMTQIYSLVLADRTRSNFIGLLRLLQYEIEADSKHVKVQIDRYPLSYKCNAFRFKFHNDKHSTKRTMD